MQNLNLVLLSGGYAIIAHQHGIRIPQAKIIVINYISRLKEILK